MRSLVSAPSIGRAIPSTLSDDRVRPVDVCITIAGSDSVIRLPLGSTLLEAIHSAGVETDESCAGTGTCGECRIRFEADPPDPTLEDRDQLTPAEVDQGWRLACQHSVTGDRTIELPPPAATGELRIVTESYGDRAELRERAVVSGRVGLAVDLGTTTIASFLVEENDAAPIGVDARTNPQRRVGSDVIARIARAHESSEDLYFLRDLVVEAIEASATSICLESGVDPRSVDDVVVVGNSTMIHLLWGVDPFPLAVVPYDPVFLEPVSQLASQLGFRSFPRAAVKSLPGVGGHVGSDIVAGLLALDLLPSAGPRLFLDLGTNGEIVLAIGESAVACSTAAGPAFEGVHISDGMPAVDGAISGVDLIGEELVISTIGGRLPVGLCGSGLVDGIVALLQAGVIAPNGRVADPDDLDIPPAIRRRIEEQSDGRSVTIADGVGITQADVRQVQLAVSAMRTGVEVLLAEVGVRPDKVVHTYVAGGFGSSLRSSSLMKLGVLPPGVGGVVEPVGNVAGRGARLVASNPDLLREARRVAGAVRHVRIEESATFTEGFIRNTGFPPVEL